MSKARITLQVDRITMLWDGLSTDEKESLHYVLPSTELITSVNWPRPHKWLYVHSFSDLGMYDRALVDRLLFGARVLIRVDHIQPSNVTLQYEGYVKSFGKNKLNGEPTVALCIEMIEGIAGE